MKVIGIDPGIHGGLAMLCTTTQNTYNFSAIYPLPTIQSSKGRFDLDLNAFISLIHSIHDPDLEILTLPIDLAIIEHPPIIPGNGVLAYRSLFKGWGEIRGILSALKVPFEEPIPQLWKKEVLAGTKKDKEAAICYVKNRFPSITIPPHPKPKRKGDLHDGIADAVCLAEYGRRLLANRSITLAVENKDEQQ